MWGHSCVARQKGINAMYCVCLKGKKMFVCHGYSWSEEFLVQTIESIVEIKSLFKVGVREETKK